ncbi:MAG: chromosomal replication initiator protein DnaA [Pseudomonadota bacterium]
MITAEENKSWERVRAKLQTKLGSDVYSSWFGRCKLERIHGGQVLLSVPTTFLKTWINTHYLKLLEEFWAKENAEFTSIGVVVRSAVRSSSIAIRSSASKCKTNTSGLTDDAGMAAADETSPGVLTSADAQTPDYSNATQGFAGSPLDPRYTFSTFIEGSSNRMACAAAKSVMESGINNARFNPLFIHASVGLGKTHLLQAIAWSARLSPKGMKVLYLTAEYFMWRFATAIRDQSALSFKESLRDIDILLIDDMQFLQGKSIQQEFCHLLNALIDSAKQVVVAADRPPADLESLDERVRSRLQGGAALEIKAPDLAMRRSMLEMRYEQACQEDTGLSLSPEILDYVAHVIATSGRDVEGAFNQLLIQHRFSDGQLTIENVETILGHLVRSNEQKRVRIEDIQKVVAKHFNVTKNDLLSNRRTRVIVRPRQIAMYLSKVMTPRSLPEIGRRFGGRDHTTVLHAVRKIEKMAGDDQKLSREIELLKRLINE